MSLTNETVANALGNLTVVELIALTKALEERWGLEAKPLAVMLNTTSQEVVKMEVKTEFDVMLTAYPADKKMAMVKLVREVLTLGILEAKNFVEACPKTLKEGLTQEEAEALKAQFVALGATVEVK